MFHRLRRWPNIETTLGQFIVLAGMFLLAYKPTNTKRSPDDGTMLAHRLRRWPNIVPASSERLVFFRKRYVTSLAVHLHKV